MKFERVFLCNLSSWEFSPRDQGNSDFPWFKPGFKKVCRVNVTNLDREKVRQFAKTCSKAQVFGGFSQRGESFHEFYTREFPLVVVARRWSVAVKVARQVVQSCQGDGQPAGMDLTGFRSLAETRRLVRPGD